MASRTLNPRFDHTCVIYRRVGGTELTQGRKEILYEGKCYIYEANNLRTYTQKISFKEDMGCDIPIFLDTVRVGDLIDFDRYGDKGIGLTISNTIPSKMGSSYRFNLPKI